MKYKKFNKELKKLEKRLLNDFSVDIEELREEFLSLMLKEIRKRIEVINEERLVG